MRLTLKLLIVLFPIILLTIVIDGYLSVRREIDLFHNNMQSTAVQLGQLAGGMVSEAMFQNNPERALRRIHEINRAENSIRIRWIYPSSVSEPTLPPDVRPEYLLPVEQGRDTSLHYVDEYGRQFMRTYVPVNAKDMKLGAIELEEPMGSLRHYTRETAIRVVILSVVLILLGLGFLWILGNRYVGQPLKQLVEKTRRIGQGNFSCDLTLSGHHELSQLAGALNQMCAQLQLSREKLRAEVEKRLSTMEQLRHTERLATVGRLASGVAHELGTPLNVITGRAKLLSTEKLDSEEIGDYSRIIVEQTERIIRIIRQLLDFARRRQTHRMSTIMRQLCSQVLDLLRPMAGKARVTLKLVEEGESPGVSVDQSQIQQVLMNFVMNAIQAMPRGGTVEIKLYPDRRKNLAHADAAERDYLAIDITDQGEGIAPENLNLIFDPFFSTKDVGQGTGLGLSIAYGIIEEHKGWIAVESTVGKGTRFTIYLPAEERG
jgi:two-component system NtrC family sensor kinase